MIITERLNSFTTRIVQCAPRLIHVKSYNLIMIMTCRTTAQNEQCERRVRICADFQACWYLLIFPSSMLIFYIFNLGGENSRCTLYIASYIDSNVSSNKGKKATPQFLTRVGWRTNTYQYSKWESRFCLVLDAAKNTHRKHHIKESFK